VSENLLPYRDALLDVALEAGEAIMDVYKRDFAVTAKTDDSPLTEADLAAHRIIGARLAAMAAQIPVLSEESDQREYAQRRSWREMWLVDPLDGTKEFVSRNGEFTVNIALVREGQPLLGVVHAPALGRTYAGIKGEGAWTRVDGRWQPIAARRYTGGRAVVVVSRSHRGKAVDEFLARLEAKEGTAELVSSGSSLKLCLVAEGAADVYPRLGPTSEWDTGAGQVVVEAAGGKVRDLHMHPLRYNKVDLLNPWFIAAGSGDYDWTQFSSGLMR
jgi:3'(2'), 5'-bisphosphate nucleotidase